MTCPVTQSGAAIPGCSRLSGGFGPFAISGFGKSVLTAPFAGETACATTKYQHLVEHPASALFRKWGRSRACPAKSPIPIPGPAAHRPEVA
jgi:hypothetical protein